MLVCARDSPPPPESIQGTAGMWPTVHLPKLKLFNLFGTVSWVSASPSQPSWIPLSCETTAALFGIREALRIRQFGGCLPNSSILYATSYPLDEFIMVSKALMRTNNITVQGRFFFLFWKSSLIYSYSSQCKGSGIYLPSPGLPTREMKSKLYPLFHGRVSFKKKVRCLNTSHKVSLTQLGTIIPTAAAAHTAS